MASMVFETQMRMADKAGLLADWKKRNRYRITDVERILNCGQTKAYELLKNPEKLSVAEIRRMRLTDEEKLRLLK